MSDPSKTASTSEKRTASPLRTGRRAKEAEQWSLKHDEQGIKFYFNSTTKKSQSQDPGLRQEVHDDAPCGLRWVVVSGGEKTSMNGYHGCDRIVKVGGR